MRDDLAGPGSSAAPPAGSLLDTPEDRTEYLGPSSDGAGPSVEPPRPSAAWNRASHYRLLSPLGIGGMGIVYRAEDTRLGRTVALKFLPPALTPNPQAKVRFLQEARAAAALDHPNVCTIFEIGETADGQLFIAMACYEGETLKCRLERGLMSVAEAVRIAAQVARGLAKAHGRGIVHRDIKPANLVITSDGVVKILDFGIAELPGTGARAIRPLPGTPAYMSPEQARGEKVDARSDLWSLGVVLHEMLAGGRPGGGRSGAAGVPPDPQLPERRGPAIPPKLARVLSRLLAPNPDDRYPDASVLLADLAGVEGAAATPRAPSRRAAVKRWLLVPALSIALAVIVGRGTWLPEASRQSPGPVPIAPPPATYVRLTDLPGRESFPSLSPDEKSFLYAKTTGGRSRIFLQRVGGGVAEDLSRDSTADDTQPAFSPNGRLIAFRSERDGGGLFIMSAAGGSARRLAGFGFNPAWSPDGRELAVGTDSVVHPSSRRQPSEIFRVRLDTGERRLVRGRDAAQPSWSPHGYRIAYWGVSPSGQRIVWTVAADGGLPVQVTHDPSLDWNPAWSPDGRQLYFASDRGGLMNLWRVPIDERSGRVLGRPEPVTVSSRAGMQWSISGSGKQFVFAGDDIRVKLEKIAFDLAAGKTVGAVASIDETFQRMNACDASRDGRWLVYDTLAPKENIYVIRPDGKGLRLVVGGDFRNRLPRWSPDSTRIAFYSNRGGNYEIWTVRADGGGLAPATAFHASAIYHPIWSPDGLRLACDFGEHEGLVDLSRPLAQREPRFLPPPGPRLGFTASSWSVDGRWLAGLVHRLDQVRYPGIVLYSLADRRYVRLTRHGESPCWLSDSLHLLFLDRGEVWLLDTRTRRSRRVLTAPPGSVYADLAASPDNRVLYLSRTVDEGNIWLLAQK
ncbi:MAG TPA: protein kinase [Thermoanaerobaculia bacterium]|nr:protein kinase [Thermoanaerobaculia bacterium]